MIATDQGDYYTTNCLLDYPYFKEYYKRIATDFSKQQALDAYPKAMQEINFNGNLKWNESATMFFIVGVAKEIISDFSQRTVRVL